MLHTLSIALHILFAAAWFGLGLALPALVRAQRAGSAPQARRVITMMNASIVLFYGFAVLNWTLGMQTTLREAYNVWPYHTSMTLGLILVAVQFGLIWLGWRKLTAGGADAEKGAKRITMGVGIGHAVWLGTFVLMYIGRGIW
ncbi:MAG: hypothetical protein AAFQ43_02735 [Bacteroidota bacterium]